MINVSKTANNLSTMGDAVCAICWAPEHERETCVTARRCRVDLKQVPQENVLVIVIFIRRAKQIFCPALMYLPPVQQRQTARHQTGPCRCERSSSHGYKTYTIK